MAPARVEWRVATEWASVNNRPARGGAGSEWITRYPELESPTGRVRMRSLGTLPRPEATVFTNRRRHPTEATSSKVLELYRKRSGAMKLERELILRPGVTLR
jgi:hypothetical protein